MLKFFNDGFKIVVIQHVLGDEVVTPRDFEVVLLG